MINAELAKIFYEMALLLEMEEVPFRPRAFEKASLSIGSMEDDIAEIYKKGGAKALLDIPDVGKGIAERIEEYIKTGHVKDHEAMKKKIPIDLEGLKAVEGLGPKKIKLLWQKLKIRNLADLEKAARAGKIRKIETLGQKTEENILRGIGFVKSGGGRFLLGDVYGLVKDIESRLLGLAGVEKAIAAGSFRRMKETVGDADFLVVSAKSKPVMDYFVKMTEVEHVYARGNTKTLVRLKDGLDCDLRVVNKESFGAALNYFTGSKYHNVALREIAIKKGLKLNEYGLYRGRKLVVGKTEDELYKALGLTYIEPELRENTGEIDAALRQAQGKRPGLPQDLIGYGDLKGDLQVQTTWTDGAYSIEEMANEAKKRGLSYIAITDHTKSLAMTGGADEKKLEKQMAEIDKLNKKLSGITLLKGAEVNILPSGLLDINDQTLAKLDCVGVAVHSNFRMSRAQMTKRIIRAIENPHIDILFHPTGRIINRRPAYEVDMDEVIKAAKRTGTILEIDASPERLDLRDEYIRKCVDAGVGMVIDSDAHGLHGFQFLKFGIAQARRGWAERSDIINTKPLKGFLKALK